MSSYQIKDQSLTKIGESYQILDFIPVSCQVIDFNWRFLYLNDTAAKQIGRPKTDILGHKIRDFSLWSQNANVLSELHWCMNELVERRIQTSISFAWGTKGDFEIKFFPIGGDVLVVMVDVTGIDKVTEQMQHNNNMQFYIGEITRAQEDERKRISRDLHDDVAQSLACLCLEMDSIYQFDKSFPEGAITRLHKIRSEVSEILASVRRFSHELRPGDLDTVGLVPTLERIIGELNYEGRCIAHLSVVGQKHKLSDEMEITLFRIAQEALRNITKHSHAKEVIVKLEFFRDKITLDIIDDGVGFNFPKSVAEFAPGGKLGLIGMGERAKLLGGSFRVKSKPGEGTTVMVQLPLGI